jgi:hypothetical protein
LIRTKTVTNEENTMTRTNRLLLIAVAVVLAVAATIPVAAETTASESVIGGESCCFTNPRFSGVCKVTPGENETCGDILAYLNNQSSTGKAYCGNTPVRGGWAQVECEASTTAGMCSSTATDQPKPKS